MKFFLIIENLIMIYRKLFILLCLFFFGFSSCTSIKNALTGKKAENSDEFLIKKKYPLILPPDYEDLPTPGERTVAKQEVLTFEEAFKESLPNDESSSSGSTEESILKRSASGPDKE